MKAPGRTAPAPQALARPAAPRWLVWLALGTVYLVWGSTYLAIKVAIETLPSLVHAGLRFLIAGVIVVGVVAVTRPAALRITRSQFASVAAAGVLLLLGGNGLVVLGEEGVASGLAALFVAALPLWIVVLRALFGDRPARTTVCGVAVGFAGVAVLLRPGAGGSSDLGHGALVVGASLCWAIGSFLATRRPMPANPFVATGLEMLCGGAALLAVGLARGELSGFSIAHVSGRSWFAFAYLIVFGSLAAFTAYVWLLGSAPVSQVATYAYVNPAVAVVLGALVLGERVNLTVLAGGLIILVAVAVVVAEEGRRQRRTRPITCEDPGSPA
ncbi:MAG: EamA family transporter [Actinomycetota bacterium]|nr:EamA family transporter [Actinomycetota bacterium]